jgi:hypothetical protein
MVLDIIAVDQEKDPGELSLLSRLIDALDMPEESMSRVYDRYFEERRAPRR